MESPGLIRGLDAFAEQFAAQIENAGPPGSEHAVHFCLALGFQAALGLSPGSVVFERPILAGRLDVWIRPCDIAFEVKYRRPIPSGRNLPATQIFGALLADFNKVVMIEAVQRVVVYVTDDPGMNYLQRNASGILGFDAGTRTEILATTIERLPTTASRAAIADGPWQPLIAQVAWQRKIEQWHLLAWEVEPRSSR